MSHDCCQKKSSTNKPNVLKSALVGALTDWEKNLQSITALAESSSTSNSSFNIQPAPSSANLAVVEYDFNLNATDNTTDTVLPNNSYGCRCTAIANPIVAVNLGSFYNYNTGLLQLAFNPNALPTIPSALISYNSQYSVIIGSIIFKQSAPVNGAMVSLRAANTAALVSNMMQYLCAVPIYETASGNRYINGFNIVLSPAGINAFMLATNSPNAVSTSSSVSTAIAAAAAALASASSAASSASSAASSASSAASSASSAASSASSASSSASSAASSASSASSSASSSAASSAPSSSTSGSGTTTSSDMVAIATSAAVIASTGIINTAVNTVAIAISGATTGVEEAISNDIMLISSTTTAANFISSTPLSGIAATYFSKLTSNTYPSYESDASTIITTTVTNVINTNSSTSGATPLIVSGVISVNSIASDVSKIVQYVCNFASAGITIAIQDVNTAIANHTFSQITTTIADNNPANSAMNDVIIAINNAINSDLSAASPAAVIAIAAVANITASAMATSSAVTAANSATTPDVAYSAIISIVSNTGIANANSIINDIATFTIQTVWATAYEIYGAAQQAAVGTNATANANASITSAIATNAITTTSTGLPATYITTPVLVSYELSYFTNVNGNCAVPAPTPVTSGYDYLGDKYTSLV
jgi:hypothetical protein